MKQTDKKPEKEQQLTYKVVNNLHEMDFYTDDKQEAETIFKQYVKEYGDGIRLYEAIKTEGNEDAPEWEIIDCHDEDDEAGGQQHTPGEWEAKQITKKQIIIGIKGYGTDNNYRKDNRCGQIAQIHGWDGEKSSELSEEDKANAARIVQAVNNFDEMKAVIEKLHYQLQTWAESDSWSNSDEEAYEAGSELLNQLNNQ